MQQGDPRSPDFLFGLSALLLLLSYHPNSSGVTIAAKLKEATMGCVRLVSSIMHGSP